MKLRIEIEFGNDALYGEHYLDEVERILTNLVSRLPCPLKNTNGELSLHDVSGNWVGYAIIVPGTIEIVRKRK